MPLVRKVLGQSRPVAAAETTIYTVPAATSTIVSTLTIANDGVATTFRVRISPAGAASAAVHDLFPTGAPIGPNQLISLTAGLTLAPTDVVRVYAAAATCTFQLFGEESS